jgi:hypothetical protein
VGLFKARVCSPCVGKWRFDSENRYPGLVVLEGLEQDADEFVARIKRLQWQGACAEEGKDAVDAVTALQVRCEETSVVELPTDLGQTPTTYVLSKAKLARDGKPGIQELESLAEVSARCALRGWSGGTDDFQDDRSWAFRHVQVCNETLTKSQSRLEGQKTARLDQTYACHLNSPTAR